MMVFHTCIYRGGIYEIHEPIWINPDYIISIHPRTEKLRTYTVVRLHGDQSCQDWTMLYESPDVVFAALKEKRDEA